MVGKRLRVEGGPDQEMVSTFGGPVIFSNNINVLGGEGVQAVNLNLSGDLDQPRKITMSDTKPLIDGKVGDIVLNAVPASGGFTGWVYTTESTWRQFGLISTSDAETNLVVDGVFANDDVVGYAGSFTNLNVTGIGTIFNANIQSGISSVDATSTKDLYCLLYTSDAADE